MWSWFIGCRFVMREVGWRARMSRSTGSMLSMISQLRFPQRIDAYIFGRRKESSSHGWTNSGGNMIGSWTCSSTFAFWVKREWWWRWHGAWLKLRWLRYRMVCLEGTVWNEDCCFSVNWIVNSIVICEGLWWWLNWRHDGVSKQEQRTKITNVRIESNASR